MGFSQQDYCCQAEWTHWSSQQSNSYNNSNLKKAWKLMKIMQRCCRRHQGKDCHAASGWCTHCFCDVLMYFWGNSAPVHGNWVLNVHSQGPLSRINGQLEGRHRRMFLHLVHRKNLCFLRGKKCKAILWVTTVSMFWHIWTALFGGNVATRRLICILCFRANMNRVEISVMF